MPTPEQHVHGLVARFLEHHGYTEALRAFRSEASQHLTTDMGLTHDQTDLVASISQLSLGPRLQDLPRGDGVYYGTLSHSVDTLHATNILALATRGDVVATSATDKTVKLHSLNDWSTTRTYKVHSAPVLSMAFHPVLSSILLTTSMDGTAALIDTSPADDMDAHVLQLFKDHQRYIVHGCFSDDGQYLCTASYDHTVCVYVSNRTAAASANADADNDNGDNSMYRRIGKMGPFVGNVECICFLPCTEAEARDQVHGAQLLVAVQNDNYLRVIDIDERGARETRKINLNANGDDWVSFSPVWLTMLPAAQDDVPAASPLVLVATDHSSGRMILLDTVSGQHVQNYYVHPSDNKFITRRHAFHPSGAYFYAIGSEHDNAIKVVETKTGNVVSTLLGHGAMVRALAVHGTGLLTTGFDHAVKLWVDDTDDKLR
ncbi:WD40-repeat-containing domain protein [Gongronella butleri]|nr:WD40-repeat-containing domain protein [Gongronella butleri]